MDMSWMVQFLSRLLTWLIFISGVVVAILFLGMLGATQLPRQTVALSTFLIISGLLSLLAAAMVLRSRRWTAFLYLLCAPGFSAYFLAMGDINDAEWPLALFAALAGFWFLTERRRWPQLVNDPPWTWPQKALLGASGLLVVATVPILSVSLATSPPGVVLNCDTPEFLYRAPSTSQIAFITKVLHADRILGS